MREIILGKYGEIALKGLNKHSFENVLFKNIKRRLKGIGEFSLTSLQSTVYIEPLEESFDIDEALRRTKFIFGISAICKAYEVEKDFEKIKQTAITYLEEELRFARTFKVVAKRSDKKFHMKSPDICMELGGCILEKYANLSVDVHKPEVTVFVEIRDKSAYVYTENLKGAGGLPVGSSGRSMLLLSGGIDSPVAGYMMAKRGLAISAIHFVSPPYTSERALLKVEELCQKMTDYCGNIAFHCVPFTEIQENIKRHCPEEYFTIIMRRIMVEIAERIALENDCLALITGESVGQVASQTLTAIHCTDVVSNIPVFRPVIGMDKTEIVEISKKIDTFDISIQPYEDCCTVFTPKHPKTKPRLEEVEEAQNCFDFSEMVEKAIAETSVMTFKFDFK